MRERSPVLERDWTNLSTKNYGNLSQVTIYARMRVSLTLSLIVQGVSPHAGLDGDKRSTSGPDHRRPPPIYIPTITLT